MCMQFLNGEFSIRDIVGGQRLTVILHIVFLSYSDKL